MFKKLGGLMILTIAATLLLTACGGEDTDSLNYSPSEGETVFTQLSPPQIGDPIATVHTSMGDITFRLFPQYAPNSVDNFIGMAESGWYDDATFYRVTYQFVVQGGYWLSTDTIFDGPFYPENDTPLHNIRGAVGFIATGTATTSSIYFVQNYDVDYEVEISDRFRIFIENPTLTETDLHGNDFVVTENIPIPFLEHYIEHGGMWRLDYPGMGFAVNRPTVFGQVITGMDVVDAIASVPNTGLHGNPQRLPFENIYILGISFGYYGE